MKTKTFDGSKERMVLTAMVMSKKVLAKIATRWTENGLFRSKFANIIGGWCVRHFRKYGKAPGSSIVSIFASWAQTAKEKTVVESMDDFITGLSEEHKALKKELNPAFVNDQAGILFNEVGASKLKDDIGYYLESGEVHKAIKAIKDFHRVEMGQGETIDVFQDTTSVKEAFTERVVSIVQYPHGLGSFFGNALCRDGFICFMAGEKRGKTWWLLDLAWRAALQRNRVLLLQVGDLTKNQVERRLGIRAVRRPIAAKKIWYPTSISLEGGQANVELERREFKKSLDWREVVRAYKKIMEEKLSSEQSFFKMQVHPARTLSAEGVRGIVENFANDGWPPDVVVIDYADILAPIDRRMEKLEQVNETWIALNRLRQEFHCLVVSATQIKATGYKAHVLSEEHFSENHLKFAHVTGMVGINRTEDEKLKGIQRLNWVVLREDEFLQSKPVHTAGCLAIGNPAIRSIF